MTYEQILFTKEENLGLIMLNRPDKLNAWTPQMLDEMLAAIMACNDDPNIGAMVISGMGRAFCAGADVAQFRQRLDVLAAPTAPAADTSLRAVEWVKLLRQSKPTIAAVNGIAVGIGVTQILPMDIRICSDQARFGFFFVNMGITPELLSSTLLPQLVGMGRAREWCLRGHLIPAEEALATGLVTHVYPHAELLVQAKNLAREIATKSRTAVLAIKEVLDDNAFAADLEAVHQREQIALSRCFKSWEHREAVTAFLEKRPPDFSPRY